MAAFKAEPLVIEKRKQVEFTTRDGETTSYAHAELSNVTEVVCPAMSRHELSHRWDVRQEAGRVSVTCIVTHADGHSESVTMDAAPDASGKKNAIQQIASAVTYLQRYTLMAICGVAARGVDDDGQGAGGGDKSGEEDAATKLANSLYDEISIAESGAELLPIKEKIKAAQVPDGVRRNLVASYNARRKVLAGETGAASAQQTAAASQENAQ
jgi:hypothetical protein